MWHEANLLTLMPATEFSASGMRSRVIRPMLSRPQPYAQY